MINSVPTEHEEQKALFEWAQWQRLPGGMPLRDLMWAIPNGGKRSKQTAAVLRSEGVTKGVPDLMLAYPCGPFHGLFIEMKRAKKSLSTVKPEQKEWLARLSAQGYAVRVCYGAREAMETILKYLNLKDGNNECTETLPETLSESGAHG